MAENEKTKTPAKLARRRFEKIKEEEPEKAEKIVSRVSGEIYGLYPTPYGYTSDIRVDVVFKEGVYQYGLD